MVLFMVIWLEKKKKKKKGPINRRGVPRRQRARHFYDHPSILSTGNRNPTNIAIDKILLSLFCPILKHFWRNYTNL